MEEAQQVHQAHQAISDIQRANLEWLARELERYRKTVETPLREAVLNGTIDRAEWYRLFELAVAFETGLVMWENLPPCAFENKNLGYFRRLTAQGKKPPDRGIDCASLDLDRVVQAKWYAGISQVPWRDMSTFHSLATVCAASERTVVSRPGVKLHSLARGLDLAQTELSDLRFLEICALCSQTSQDLHLDAFLDELLGEPAEQVERVALPPLRHCQEQAIELALQSFEDHDTIAVSMPCGTGKSRVIAELVRVDASESPHLVLVPSKLLMYQMEESFGMWAPELKVGLVGDGHAHSPGADVYVCIYNSVSTLTSLEWGMIVVDEAHHVFEEFLSDFSDYPDFDASRAYAETIRSLSYEKTLLMSATIPDEDSFPLAYSYTIGEAVEDGILCDYQIIIPVFGDGSPRDGIVRLLESHLEWGRVLAYCNSLDAASQFSTQLNACGITADWFGGDTPIKERLRRISALRNGELRVLVTVHTLGEGVDIPEADCCVFVEPRGSPVDVTQCVGRVLRQSPGKTIASVVLPSSNEERDLVRFLSLLGSSDHRIRCGEGGQARIAVVVDQPEVLDEDAELLYESTYSRTGALLTGGEWMVKYEILKQYVAEHGKLPSQKRAYLGVKLGLWCNYNRQRFKKGIATDSHIELLEGIPGWEWEPRDSSWSNRYSLLVSYINEHHKLPSQKVRYMGVHLGGWCTHVRSMYKEKSLSEDRIKQLETLSEWTWFPKEATWSANYGLLKDFIAKNHRLPRNREEYVGVKLGVWCGGLRTSYERKTLSNDRIELMNMVPEWRWENASDDLWTSKYNLLVEYIKNYRSVPSTDVCYKEIKIGSWCSIQRMSYKKGSLRAERINRLEAIDLWSWDAFGDSWDSKYRTLRNFVLEFGRIPNHRELYLGMNIGDWCLQNRNAYKKGTIRADRVKRLEMVDGWLWYPKNVVWESKYNSLKKYVNEFGRIPPAKTIYDGIKLGQWCTSNRSRRDKLSQERINMLNVIPNWFWEQDLETEWRKNFDVLKQYVDDAKKLPTAKTTYLGVKIGVWCTTNKVKQKKGTLSDAHTKQLESIEGWYWSKKQ